MDTKTKEELEEEVKLLKKQLETLEKHAKHSIGELIGNPFYPEDVTENLISDAADEIKELREALEDCIDIAREGLGHMSDYFKIKYRTEPRMNHILEAADRYK